MADDPKVELTKTDREPVGSDLPMWLRVGVIISLTTLLVVHVVIDVVSETYTGTPVSMMLGGIVGTALGLNEFTRGRGGSQ